MMIYVYDVDLEPGSDLALRKVGNEFVTSRCIILLHGYTR